MKWNAIILLICLLVANLPIDALAFSSCCEEKKELCDTAEADNSEEEKGCCEDSSCQCQCCHINNFISQDEIPQSLLPTFFVEAQFNYEFQYSMDAYSSLFRPPLV